MTNAKHSGVRALAAVLALVGSSGACLQPSLNPLFLPKDAVFEDALLGAWVCGEETWTFARLSDGDTRGDAYRVTVQTTDSATTSELAVWLGRLDQALFATFMPKSDVPMPTRFFGRHLIAVYTFGRITIEPSRLRLDMLDADWVESAEAAGLLTIGQKREEPHADVLLTGKPSELQRFAKTYADNAHVFGERIEFARAVADVPAGSSSLGEPAGRCYSEK